VQPVRSNNGTRSADKIRVAVGRRAVAHLPSITDVQRRFALLRNGSEPDNASRNNDPMLMQIPVSSESKEAWADFLNDVTNTRRNLPCLYPKMNAERAELALR